MNNEELILKAIRYQLINELFTDVMLEQSQDTIIVADGSSFDVLSLIRKLAGNELLVTNANYAYDKGNFSLIDASGDIILTISPDGSMINHKDLTFYLEDKTAMKQLIRLYGRVLRSGKIYSLAIGGE